MKVFMDTEFTGLKQDTKLISIGLVSEDGRNLYCERKLDRSHNDDFHFLNVRDLENWQLVNVVPHLLQVQDNFVDTNNIICNNLGEVAKRVHDFLVSFDEPVQMVVDVGAYDWVLFRSLFSGRVVPPRGCSSKIEFPENVHYIPFEFSTMLEMRGFDPDCDRRELAEEFGVKFEGYDLHNAMCDAQILRKCYSLLKELHVHQVKAAKPK